MEKEKFIQDFTQGSIAKKLLRFSLPFMLSNALQMFYSLVDMLVVGQYIGSAGLSAVSIGGNIFNFLAMFALGFCNSGHILISQQIGAGRRDKVSRTIGTLAAITAAIAVVMTVLSLTFYRQILNLLQTPPESYKLATDYVLVCGGGVLFTYGYNLVSAILRGMGDSKHPFIFILISTLLNLLLDILFVGPMGMGTLGAALATIIGQGVSFLFALFFLYRHREEMGFDVSRGAFRPDRDIAKTLMKLGIPLTLSSCAINVSMIFVTGLVNTAGVAASAAYGVGVKLDDVVNRITMGLSMGGSTVVGQNFAARKFDRVKKTVYTNWFITLCVFVIFTIVYVLFAREMFSVFTSDEEVLDMAPVFVSAVVWSFPAYVLLRGTYGFIQGLGNARLLLITSLLDGFVFRIGLSWLFGMKLGFGVWGYFFGYGLAAYGTAIPLTLYFFFAKWEKRGALAEAAE